VYSCVVVVIALYSAIRVVCFHDVSMIVIGVEGADQGEEEPSHHNVAPKMSLPYKPSQEVRGQYAGRKNPRIELRLYC
jgi:hypothetical protein